jgi:predicted dehydrogenase
MTNRLHRRDLLKTSAVLGMGYWLGTSPAGRAADSPNEKLNVACIGIGGRGGANVKAMAGENIVALCDVDDERAGGMYERFPGAKKYYDFRRMLDEMEKQIDAVVVSTPDHTHFHPSMMAMTMGKHLYVEKPMAHSVWEVRQMTDLAREKKLATQLGAQRHAMSNMHRVVELIKSGAIGQVSEVYSWIGGTRGMPEVPTEFEEPPSHLKWDLWLGPAKERPYHKTYCPYGWRFWWDFGTGETGNWGCHILDIPFWALDLKYPQTVDVSGPPVHPETTPKSMHAVFEFPKSGDRPAVTLDWQHTAAPEVLKKYNLPGKGANTLFIGDEGMLLCGFGMRKLYPEEKFRDFTPPAETVPDSPGFHREWIDACKGGQPATCHFDYSGPLTETVLLGNAAYRAKGGFTWDAASLTTKGNPRVAQFIKTSYRDGWEV